MTAKRWFKFKDRKLSKSRPQPKAIGIFCDPRHTAAVWLSEVVAEAPKTNLRDVLVRLVGALLRIRGSPINGKRNRSQQRQAGASGWGDFNLGRVSYHVAYTPTSVQLQKCKQDLDAHRFPVLLVSRLGVCKAHRLAERARIKKRLTILTLEDFLGQGLLFQALQQGCTMFTVWESIIGEYNRRIETTSVASITLKQASRRVTSNGPAQQQRKERLRGAIEILKEQGDKMVAAPAAQDQL